MKDDSSSSPSGTTAGIAPSIRAAWMRDLALADSGALDTAMTALTQRHTLPAFRVIRAPETGMAMVRGRAGGNGAPFNIGEMTITRCALTLDSGELGLAYVQGRDRRHAEHAAYADALLQTAAWQRIATQDVIEPLRRTREAQATARAVDNDASRVDFFTLARGNADGDVGNETDDENDRQPPAERPENDSHVD